MTQFETITDNRGDVWCRGGVARNLTATIERQIGPNDGSYVFLGGSGLNLVLSGFPTPGPPNGVWRRLSAYRWQAGDFVLTKTGSTADIRTLDLANVVATLGTGAPLGSYAAATYGIAEFGAFTAVAAGEFSSPGEWPIADLTVSAGSAAIGELTSADGETFTLTGDTAWTVVLMADGTAELKNGSTVVAIREAGDPGDPSGTYVATPAGQLTYYAAPAATPSPPPVPDDDPAPVTLPPPDSTDPTTETDPDVILPADDTPDDVDPPPPPVPFGLLTLEFRWDNIALDLDVGITFLAGTIGQGYTYAGGYMSRSVDDGLERIEIDLAEAFDAEAITDLATINVAADWTPSSGSEGIATLIATYENGDESWTAEYALQPKNEAPATTLQAVFTVAAWNPTPAQKLQPWAANIQLRSVPPADGYVFATLVESSGTLSTVSGPAFAAAVPANTTTQFAVAIAQITGGRVRQIYDGAIIWRDSPPATGGGGGTIPIIALESLAEYLALDVEDQMNGSIYLIPKDT